MSATEPTSPDPARPFRNDSRSRAAREDEWLWGFDQTPGIVSVWATADGRATVWRRIPETGQLVREEDRFRCWALLASLDDLVRAGGQPRLEEPGPPPPPDAPGIWYRELAGPGRLRYLVSAAHARRFASPILAGASQRLGRPLDRLSALGQGAVLYLPPEEQYLVATGKTYFRGLAFDQLARLQLDLETTGLDPAVDRIFMAAIRRPDGTVHVLESPDDRDESEGALIRRLIDAITEADPDVIENHNLHGFDLPFLARRARRLGIPLVLGRVAGVPTRTRPARRLSGAREPGRMIVPGRELIDTLDAVRRYDFATRELPGHGLKAVAQHLGLARPDREHVPGPEIHATFRRDPDRVRRYAAADVEEAAGIARVLGGAAFALARMAPRRYERLADAGAATGVLDPLLVRAYLREGAALPAHEPGDGTPHAGAALHLFAAGVAHRVVKADVASLYPSLMRAHRIGPGRDRLGVFLTLVDRLVEHRLAAKARARSAAPTSAERHAAEAESAAMKLVINSAYGYLAAGGDLTRFADVHAANEVTRHGRELLALICRELERRGGTLLEADTDGVYFSAPPGWTEEHERRAVREVGALLPSLVQLELEGRFAAMLSHEPKNYALLHYDGRLVLRGVAFRSSRAEPFGDRFLRRALSSLLAGDVPGVQAAWLDTLRALRRRELATADVAARVRLTKTPAEYAETRSTRRELAYEALLENGRDSWRVGERIRVYRRQGGRAGLVTPRERHADAVTEAASAGGDPRDYDAAHYERVLRDTFAARLTRAFTTEDFETVFADPTQPSLFAQPIETIQPVLRLLRQPVDRVEPAGGAAGRSGREQPAPQANKPAAE